MGAIAVVLIVLSAVSIPVVRRWIDREALIDARRGELARLSGMQGAERQLREAVSVRETRAAEHAQRPVRATTAPLAAGEVQGILQQYADESQLSVSELNVSGEPDSVAASLPALPATLIAMGDVYGVAELLSRIQHGATLFDVREMTVQVNPSRRADGGGELLQMTLVLRAPFVIE